MSELINKTGHCLCGKVHVVVKQQSSNVGVCHCSMCRKWTGGPLLAVDCGSEVTFEGEQYITRYNSSDWAERGFCNSCGTHLFYLFKEAQQFIMMAGLFDDDTEFAMDHQIFIDEKPTYYDFANKTDNMTGAEVFAQYAPSEE